MIGKKRWTRGRKRLAATLVIALIGFTWGLMLLQLNIGQGLRRASYDLPFIFFGGQPPPQDIVPIYLDEASHSELDQPLAQPWDRRLHAKLVDRLSTEGARMIVFDILFHDEKPEQDESFAIAIRKHGNVVLAGEFVRSESEVGDKETLLLATPELRRAAAGWGLTDIPIDPDGVVRQVRHRIPTDFGDKPSLAEFVRQRAQGRARENPDALELLNYYGPAGTFRGYSYGGVLMNRGIPEGVFRDKIVIIGSRQQAGLADAGKDTFSTPYARLTGELTPGMEIQATALANLLHGHGITRLWAEHGIYPVLIAALLFAAAACLFSPSRGVPLCIALGVGVALLGIFSQQSRGFHFLWTIPAFGQMPLIAGLSLGAHYLIEYSARWKLRSAFKSYMSDEQARQIDEDDVSLELGGKEVEVTILFSDLAGFTTMSEGLPPESLSKALIRYFESATAGILDNQGTIIKYIGDAVLATWGAPLKVDRECDRAIDAAIQMQVAGAKPVTLETAAGTIEQVLETRVGIHHGLVLAGNLGSSRRFDYTVVGDSVNTAARLEGLNKMLGTSILVSDEVLAQCADRGSFLSRRMGSYVLKGKSRGIVVHEILGRRSDSGHTVRLRSEEYLNHYRRGLEAFAAGDWITASHHLKSSLPLHDREAEDPASRLMLDAIAELRSPPADWRGELILLSK
jgi:adenylate cyclase